MKIYWRLLSYTKPYLTYMIFAVLCMIILSGATAAIAYLVKPAIDDLFMRNQTEIVLKDLTGFEKLLNLASSDSTNAQSVILNKYLKKDYSDKNIASGKTVMQNAFVTAFNKMKDDLMLYPKHSDLIFLDPDSEAYKRLKAINSDHLLYENKLGEWKIKDGISRSETEDVKWFNISLLKEVYPDILIKESSRDFSMLLLIPLLIIVAYAVKGFADYGQSYLMGFVGNSVIADIREIAYRHIQNLPLWFFTSTSTGTLMSRIANDVTILQRAVSDSIKKVIISFFMAIGLTFVAFYQNWKMALTCFVLFPCLAVIINRFGGKSKKLSRRTQEQLANISTFLDETISGCQTVKAYCMEEYETIKFNQESDRLLTLNIRSLKIDCLSSPVIEFIVGTAGAVLIYIGGYSVIKGAMTAGTFFSFITAMAMLYKPIKTISRENIKIQSGIAAAIRLFQLLDSGTEESDSKGTVALAPVKKEIEFRDVSFRYEEKPVLKNISFKVNAGEVVAFVGHSGAGKTTIANMLLRFYHAQSGSIFIDGTNILDLTIKSVREQTALVTQDTILFNDTVKNNIAYGNRDVPFEDTIKAAKDAFAHDFIMAMPDGYDTVIGERGIRLSGGQRQRIAIARALIKNASILILDEATSALDSHAEKEVQKAIDKLITGRTTIIIAHRLSTVRKADKIIVIADGEIIESGNHEDLIFKKGVYKKLIEIQSGYKKRPLTPEPACV